MGYQPSGPQYGSTTMNPNTQNLQYDQSSSSYNNQQSYPSNQNSASGVQYDPNMAYSTQQNQAGYNPQAQQTDQNQYSNNGRGQAYPYNQQSQPGYSTQMDQSQNFNNQQPQMYSNGQQQYGQQYDAGNGQIQYGQPSTNQQYNNGQSQNALYGSVGSMSGNTQVQIADYSFSNGNCKYEVNEEV
ncbi:hypothetical protein TELCIR_09533 [Teladorsagia circumcincta]|uniref:Uncharacterized protein n=1 Tax=Teladorsagia circumcincta TaxID=45464 RepID=A0A2G9UEM7_TELCI|nr:hypothetical protein TELCIR_09533 [Teladorsagia circumcincta]